MAPKKRVAPAPAGIKKAAAPAKVANPLYEKRPKTFGFGGALPPKRDLHRLVRWPKYVRVQRQRRVLSQRLKVPPSVARFSKTLDKSTATTLFKLLLKYRPEDKTQKRARLQAEAEAREAGKEASSKKPLVLKYGLNHVTQLVEAGKAALVVIAHDVDPIELVVWLPAVCKKLGVPYVIVKGKARLGQLVHQKTCSALVVEAVKPEDARELALVVDAANSLYEARQGWGGGILSAKTQDKIRKRERALAREAAPRAALKA